ncbi:hypothetical protein OAJ65_02180 [Flavobacteriales bacterium]|nr:hypothetical protein [Flavobacteriales bacterium]
MLRLFKKEIEQPIVIIAQDISSSIKDSVFHELKNLSEKLSDFDVYPYSFAASMSSGFSKVNNGLKTNYSKVINEVESRFSNRNIAALIIATDGLYNNGSNPLYTHLNNYPIYPIALGDTSIKTDVKVLKVKQNEIAFLGNTFPLEVSLAMLEAEGEKIKLSVWHNGNKIHAEEIDINSNDDYKKIRILVEATDIGLQKYQIVASELDGEKNAENNSYTAYIDVIDSRYKILILHGVSHPDISAYKSAIEKNKNYTIKMIHLNDFNGNIDAFQLVVLFGAEQNVNLIKRLKESQVPLLVFEFNKTGLKEKLSTAMRFNNKGGLEEVSAVKNEQFSKFTFSHKLLDFISEAPPLSTPFGSYNLSNATEFILKQRIGMHVTSKPIISLSQQEGRKIAYVTAEGFWKWKLYDYSKNKSNEAFNELFQKLTQYLVLQEDKSRFRIEYKKQLSEDENIYFDALLFNESFELVTDKDIEISINNEKGDKYNFEFSKHNNSYILDVGKLAIGKYSFTAKAKGTYLSKSGSFEVKVIQLEQLSTIADHKLLFALAKASGGSVFNKENINHLIKKVKNNKENHQIIHTKEKLEGIINIPWILLSLLLLISIEWFVRKFNGLL